MRYSDAKNLAHQGKAVARAGWKGEVMMQHPEDPAKDPPRLIRVYPKGHKKYPAGAVRLHDEAPDDIMAEDWEDRPAP